MAKVKAHECLSYSQQTLSLSLCCEIVIKAFCPNPCPSSSYSYSPYLPTVLLMQQQRIHDNYELYCNENSTRNKMFVPEHLTVTGEELQYNGGSDRSTARQSLAEKMVVPDRITVAAVNGYRSENDYTKASGDHRSSYLSNITNHMEVPSTLTVDKLRPEEITRAQKEDNAHLNVSTDNSSAVDEDPIRELKSMRRQLGRLASRVQVLEQEVVENSKIQKSYFVVTFGAVLAFLYTLIRR